MNYPDSHDVIIAGGGPAGTSAAIQLAAFGARVLLVEEKKFPRAKLCGEFISPECLTHFKRLGVLDQMTSAGGAALAETVFYSRRGHRVSVPSEWFGSGASALGLSRSEMDDKLLKRAKEAGVVVMEQTHASGLIQERGSVLGISAKNADGVKEYRSLLTIDATGRARALARHIATQVARAGKQQPKTAKHPFVAFKAHLENARVARGACEIYFYRGGYGGLSSVEGGVSNLCFIVSADEVRLHESDPEVVMREVVMRNARASYTLAQAHASTPWLSVSFERFGPRTLTPADGLLTIGDAASFIDPFTGSGMLMALESGQIAAEIIGRYLPRLRHAQGSDLPEFETLARDYRTAYSRGFNSRLRFSGLLRRAAFVPLFAETAMRLFGTSARLRRRLARATRQQTRVLSEPLTAPGESPRSKGLHR
ncbi:MAG: NAD(P)/FAD-dependent oxidoreductase [Pyrinomonadaceae bacterium]|nr:NAD(P)/FAD-dependent oxidoreductase [Pyrinomonadaceae bacterium]